MEEGIHNLTKLALAKARGHLSMKNLLTIVYLVSSQLGMKLPI
jgi:hypothetical protein